MAHFEAAVEIHASRSRIWNVTVDVERWPEWTPTAKSVERLESSPLALGSRTRIVQPKLKPAVWTVTELDESRGIFVWASSSPGIVVTAGHLVEEIAGGTRSRHTIDYSGFLAPIMSAFLGKLTQEYIEAETRGLKQRCEAN